MIVTAFGTFLARTFVTATRPPGPAGGSRLRAARRAPHAAHALVMRPGREAAITTRRDVTGRRVSGAPPGRTAAPVPELVFVGPGRVVEREPTPAVLPSEMAAVVRRSRCPPAT